MTQYSHILIVDDNNFNRDLLLKLLLRCKYTVTLAHNGLQALEKIKVQHFDLVLLDIMMPDFDGISVLKKIRQMYTITQLPVIMVTAMHESEQIAEALNLGANDYVTKPIDKTVLTARVKSQLSLVHAHNKVASLAESLSRRNQFILKLFNRYVTYEVLDNCFQCTEAKQFEGEVRKVTILFADIRGFTPLSESLPAEDVVSILNNYFEAMIDVTRKYRGNVDQFIGDGLLVTFGASVSRRNDVERAIACALEMQLAISKVNERNKKEGYPEIQIGIGINTGEVMVGNIGSEKRASFSVIGKHVNLASRIESYASAGEILISQNTYDQANEPVQVINKKMIQPKGVDKDVGVYSIYGISGCYNITINKIHDDGENRFIDQAHSA